MPEQRNASRQRHERSRRYVLAGQSFEAPPLAPGLHIVSTPIGNLRDITLRALETLAAADVIACEDTRVTGKLLHHYGISAQLVTYQDHNAASARPRILQALADGAAVALASDAGTPLISDPGFKLVRTAHEHGHKVTAVPGPSSVLAALSLAALPTDRFFFEGFLPAKAAARRQRLAELARVPATIVVFETGTRLAECLADMLHAFGAREAAVCRELTKLYEEVRRADLAALAAAYASEPQPRGELVLVIAPPSQEQSSTEEIEGLLKQALNRLSLKDAVAEIASTTGVARSDVYKKALTIDKERRDSGER